MGPEPLSLAVFMALLNVELSQIEDGAVRAVAESTRVPPYPKHLIWRFGTKATYVAWVFAEYDNQRVGAVYCDRGAEYRDFQWGLVELQSEYFGPDTAWFSSAGELFDEWVPR